MSRAGTTLVSMSEIMRVGPWALRALGYSFGVAERATGLLAWTEAAVGLALAMLRTGETALRASIAAPLQTQSTDANGIRRLEAFGRSLFELGPPAIDLLTADLRRHGEAGLIMRGSIGSTLIPAMTDLMARRGHGVVAIYAADPDEIPAGEAPQKGWHAAIQTQTGPCFLSGQPGDGPLAPRLAKASVVVDADRLAKLEDAMAAASGGFIGLLGVSGMAAADLHGSPLAVDRAGRVAKAYREGLEVATRDLEHLYALERITWAPTSERSRKQAGY